MIALYSRVSTVEQANNGYSVDEQIERMKSYCKAMNWQGYKEYVDAGFSGASTDRPALQRMIRAIKTRKIDKVLVYKLDRLSRSQRDTLELIEDVFLANGCDFVSLNENFDTSTPFGRAMIGILAVFAQLEREQIRDRMMMGADARAKEGKYHGSRFEPIGYNYIDGELVVNPYEAMQVKRLYTKYIQGTSPVALAKELNEAGLVHKSGEWREETIRRMLQKKTYIGFIKHRNEWIKGTHQPLIDEETFNKAQREIERRSAEYKKYNRRAGKAVTYLGGYLECGRCGAKYSKDQTRVKVKGKTYKYEKYSCNSRSKKKKSMIKDPNCKNKNWKIEELDSLIFGEIRKLVINPNTKRDEKEDESPLIRKEISKLDDQLSRLMDLYTVGEIPVEVLQDRIHDLNDKKAKLEAELDRILIEQKNKLSKDESMKLAFSFGDILDSGDFDRIRSVIGKLIRKIVLDGDDITIYWNFS